MKLYVVEYNHKGYIWRWGKDHKTVEGSTIPWAKKYYSLKRYGYQNRKAAENQLNDRIRWAGNNRNGEYRLVEVEIDD